MERLSDQTASCKTRDEPDCDSGSVHNRNPGTRDAGSRTGTTVDEMMDVSHDSPFLILRWMRVWQTRV